MTAEIEEARKAEVLQFLHENVFDPVLSSDHASETLKKGIRYTIMRMNERDSAGIVQYFWSALGGTDRSTQFARQMREEGFNRFEEVIEDFRDRFGNTWLKATRRGN